MPALSTSSPDLRVSVRSATSCRKARAMGLRQIFPVHTKRIRLRVFIRGTAKIVS
jgi:hypothetical protein